MKKNQMLHPYYKVKHVYPHEDIPIEYDCWGNVTKYAKAQEIDPGDQKSFGFFFIFYFFFIFLKLLCECGKEKYYTSDSHPSRRKETTPTPQSLYLLRNSIKTLLVWRRKRLRPSECSICTTGGTVSVNVAKSTQPSTISLQSVVNGVAKIPLPGNFATETLNRAWVNSHAFCLMRSSQTLFLIGNTINTVDYDTSTLQH